MIHSRTPSVSPQKKNAVKACGAHWEEALALLSSRPLDEMPGTGGFDFHRVTLWKLSIAMVNGPFIDDFT